jgi:hypothetical protein
VHMQHMQPSSVTAAPSDRLWVHGSWAKVQRT